MNKTTPTNSKLDPAFSLLLNEFSQRSKTPGALLWICDENNLYDLGQLGANAQYLTNRFDVAESLKSRNEPVAFNDFEFDHLSPNSLQAIFYRISKEKPVVHHIIKQAKKYLAIGGTLYIAGLKNEGTKTYLDKAAKFYSNKKSTQKNGSAYWAKFQKLDENNIDEGETLDDSQYTLLRAITKNADDAITFFSKPGIFGWQQIDAGSEFLINTLKENAHNLTLSPKSLLDLGCGYGYLAISVVQKLLQNAPAAVVLTDNNAAAINAATYNCKTQNITSTVIAADAGNNIDDSFDMIVCNPPFHQGFSVDGALTEKFIRATARLLSNNGQAFFVVNSFIALEKQTKDYFNVCEKLSTNGQFSVYHMREPKRPSRR